MRVDHRAIQPVLTPLCNFSSPATFQSFYESAWQSIRQPNKIADSVAQTVKSASQKPAGYVPGLSNAQLIAGGVVFAECLGFFTVGEIIGRFKLVGYHGETSAAHH